METIYEPLVSITQTLQDLYPEEERLKTLDLHLKTGDYFAVLATVMGFIEETLAGAQVENPALKDREIILLEEIRKDLRHLNEHYRIVPKTVQ